MREEEETEGTVRGGGGGEGVNGGCRGGYSGGYCSITNGDSLESYHLSQTDTKEQGPTFGRALF